MSEDDKFISNEKKKEEYKSFIRSAEIGRYYHDSPSEYVWYKLVKKSIEKLQDTEAEGLKTKNSFVG
jgi:hypothetical protein